MPVGVYAAESLPEVFHLRQAPSVRLLHFERYGQGPRVQGSRRGEIDAQDQRGHSHATKVLPHGKVIPNKFQVDGRARGREAKANILRPGARRNVVRRTIDDSGELRGNVGCDVGAAHT